MHSFNCSIAEAVGVGPAILLQNISWWCDKNEANGRHEYDGEFWTYNSVAAFAKLFPYFSEAQIRGYLKKLETNGLVDVGNFNKISYDRTRWFCVTSKAKSIVQNSHLHLSKITNGFVQNDKPIPDSKPDSKPDNPHSPPKGDDCFDRFWESYPDQKRTGGKMKMQSKFNAIVSGGVSAETMIAAVENHKATIWAESLRVNGGKFVPNLTTWMNQHRWEIVGKTERGRFSKPMEATCDGF